MGIVLWCIVLLKARKGSRRPSLRTKKTKKHLTFLLSTWQLHKHLHNQPQSLLAPQLSQRTLLHPMHPRPFTSEIFSLISQRHTCVTSSTKSVQSSPSVFAVTQSPGAHWDTPT